MCNWNKIIALPYQGHPEGYSISVALLVWPGIFKVLLTFSSWLQDGCRTTSIGSSHTAFQVRNRRWHRHGVCPHVPFSEQERNIFPKLPVDLHMYLTSENSVSWTPLTARLAKRTPVFLRLCAGRQTRQNGVSSQSPIPAMVPSWASQGYGNLYKHQAPSCFGLD